MTYTDYLGNPVDVGDTIVYPTQRGSSAADLNTGVVTSIVPIIPVNVKDAYCTAGHTAKDLTHSYPRVRRIPYKADKTRDDSKAYMLKVRRTRDGSSPFSAPPTNAAVTLINVSRVVVVAKADG